MKNKNIINYFGILGILSFVSYLGAVIFAPLAYPDYNWMSQAVSDLSANGAPSVQLWNSLASIYNTFSVTVMIISSLVVYKSSYNRFIKIGIYTYTIMNVISSIGYSMFPLSEAGYASKFQDIMHVYVVTILVVLLSIVGLVLLIIGGVRKNGDKLLFISSIVCLNFMMLGAILSNAVSKNLFGLFERFSTLSGTSFLAVIGVWIIKYDNPLNLNK